MPLFVFFIDVWFARIDFFVAGFDSGVVDRKSVVEPSEATGAFLDSSDGAKNDEVIVVEAGTGIEIFEKVF